MKTRKTFKKLGALAISLTMLMAMGTAVFASDEGQDEPVAPAPADMDGENGVIGEFEDPDTAVKQSRAVIIYKEITVYNPEECEVNAPTITYTYTIDPGEAEWDIYDEAEAHDPEENVYAATKAGIGEPTITCADSSNADGKLVFTPEVQFQASAAGEKNAYELLIDFSGIDFTDETEGGSGAGVYRYVITEETDVEKSAAGIKDGDISDTRYLDVYVDGDGDIYGYVCFAYNGNIDARTDADEDDQVKMAFKTEGFVAGVDTNTEEDVTADEYYTFNFDLTKELVNDKYSEEHKFPFTIVLDNSGVTVEVLPIMEIDGNAEQDALEADVIGTGEDATTWEAKIAHEGVISYIGIPCGTTVTITEENDVYGVTYACKITNADIPEDDDDPKNIATGEISDEAIINCTELLTPADENHTAGDAGTITFTNTLKLISPTGVIVRYAPYILLLGAGAALFILSRRWKKKEEA
ncbi:MAG: hypothetical protein J5636_08545 [Clostridiales bacterium]|nr:hypothetical protein [Clostridiales bacterium]